MLLGGDDVFIKGKVSCILNWLLFLFAVWESQFVTQLFFSNREGVFVLKNLMVSSEIWNEVVNVVASVLAWMQVLCATSGVADWIRLYLDGH